MKHRLRRNITGLVLGLLSLLVLDGATSRLAAESPKWIGNTYHWPADGDIDPGEDLWINCETWPTGSATKVEVVYSDDAGISWSVALLQPNGTNGNNDSWHVNLGGFASGARVEYALVGKDDIGNKIWDNNGGANYSAVVSADPLISHSPADGSLTRSDDLVVSFDAPGGEGAYTLVEVVFQYSQDVPNWYVAPMELVAGAGPNHWEANLGRFLDGTAISYALVATDAAGGQQWFNYDGNNYVALVNGSNANRVRVVPTSTFDWRVQQSSFQSYSYGGSTVYHPGWHAFDGDPATYWATGFNGSPEWVLYDFGEPVRIDRYMLAKVNQKAMDFEFQGSDGGEWATLDARAGESTQEVAGEIRTYQVARPGVYSRYRLLITDVEPQNSSSSGGYIRIDDLELQQAPEWVVGQSPENGSLTGSDDLVVSLDATGGFRGLSLVEVVYSVDGGASWLDAPLELTAETGYDHWEANLGSFVGGSEIRYVLVSTDTAGNQNWFNNDGADYTAVVELPAITHSPANGSLTSTDDLVVSYDAKGGERGYTLVEVVYSTDGGATWLDAPLALSVEADHDHWEVNLGSFVGGSEIRYVLVATDAGGGQQWFNNGGADYTAVVEPPAISHTPANGTLASLDDLVITFDAQGAERGYGLVEVVYSTDGETWLAASMDLAVGTDYDHWEVNLGGFIGGSTIHYVLVATDAEGGQQWFNNGGDDYAASVAPPLIAHSPENGSLSLRDDLLVTFDAVGGERGFAQVEVTYSLDGVNWMSLPMALTAAADGDHWSANLGKFYYGTEIRYAVVATDFAGGELWYDNQGDYYAAIVTKTYANAALSGAPPYPYSSCYIYNGYPSFAFDQDPYTSWACDNLVSPPWIGARFLDKPRRVERFALEVPTGNGSYLSSFELQANSDAGWVTLPKHAVGTYAGASMYEVDNPSSWNDYRLLITQVSFASIYTARVVYVTELILEEVPDMKIKHAPENGSLTGQDDLVVTFDGTAAHGAYSEAEVTYSTDGATWLSAPLALTEESNYDHWEVNLGKFAAGASIRYAVLATDAAGTQKRLDNGGEDFTATVAP